MQPVGVEHGREVKSPFQIICGVIHPLELFMSNYLLAAIGINTVLHSVLKTKRSNDNQKAGFLSRFVARKMCLSQYGFLTAHAFVLLEVGFCESEFMKSHA